MPISTTALRVHGLSQRGTKHSLNEDFWGHANDVAWVIDGASRSDDGSAGVTEYVRALDDSLAAHCGEGPHVSLEEILFRAIAGLPRKVPPASATVAMVRCGDSECEYLVLGDSGVLFPGPTGAIRRVQDLRLAQLAQPERARFRKVRAADGSRRELQRAHEDLLKAEDAARNVPGGFWVAATDPQAAKHALVGKFARGAKPVVLATDGFLELSDDTAKLHARAIDSARSGLFPSPTKDDATVVVVGAD